MLLWLFHLIRGQLLFTRPPVATFHIRPAVLASLHRNLVRPIDWPFRFLKQFLELLFFRKDLITGLFCRRSLGIFLIFLFDHFYFFGYFNFLLIDVLDQSSYLFHEVGKHCLSVVDLFVPIGLLQGHLLGIGIF
ncbi:hypothetical protein L596_030078 [Steinernema carpocapsae]|uniref:Uncharacterized protein n=1 Tax=Steinernema carpocapsae TaxID=34508 RepID=A0A4U5LRN3_STECR|nr:hypothetical protein L596_030078 [Steinernema carpocapsae]